MGEGRGTSSLFPVLEICAYKNKKSEKLKASLNLELQILMIFVFVFLNFNPVFYFLIS